MYFLAILVDIYTTAPPRALLFIGANVLFQLLRRNAPIYNITVNNLWTRWPLAIIKRKR